MAGTVTQEHVKLGKVGIVTLTCTADASDGSYPATAITDKFEGELVALETNPGATGPSVNYDIAVTDADGVDVLQTAGANRHTSNSEIANVVFASTSTHPVVDETQTLTLAITGNIINSAVTVVRLIYQEV